MNLLLIRAYVFPAVLIVLAAALCGPTAFSKGLPMQDQPAVKPGVNEDAQILADFKKRADEYVALHKKIEASLPKLSKEATPEEIDRHQRAFAGAIASARAGAAPGDIFTPKMQVLVRALLERLFAHSDRRKLRESIMDENPGNVRVTVNGRYPDAVPLATMPAEVLRNLPQLQEDVIEYRFVSDTLILLDPPAHIVVDFVPRAMPR
jgi:hypothetical protein